MNVNFKIKSGYISIVIVSIYITLSGCNKKKELALNSKEVCEEKLPPFKEKFDNKENLILLKNLCSCIWNKFPQNGWERKVSEKLHNGEDIGWKIKSFSTVFEDNLRKCKKKIMGDVLN